MPPHVLSYPWRRFILRSTRRATSALLLIGLVGCTALGQLSPDQLTASAPSNQIARLPTPALDPASGADALQTVASDDQGGAASSAPNALVEKPAPAPAPAAATDVAVLTAEPAPSQPLLAAEDGAPRLYATAGLVKIHDEPDRDSPVIGAMRGGQSVVLTDTDLPHARTLRRSMNCTDGWYPVEPRGFVCVGGPGHGTLDGNDPQVMAAAIALPDLNADYPYRVGTSIGVVQYLRIPSAAEQRQSEPDLDAHLANLPPTDDKHGAIDATPAGRPAPAALLAYLADAQPALLHEQEAYEGYKLSWTQEFDANGRTWLLTSAMTLVPKDKVRQQPLPTLKGIDLKANPDIRLPLAFFWLGDSNKYRRGDDGKLYQTDEKWTRHSFIEATMNQARGPGGLYWEMRSGDFVKYKDVTLLRAATQRPARVGPSDKWIEARVTWGYLMAYEGDTPVYVTAMSPGAAGISRTGATTALGKHYIDWKLYSGDMSGRDRGRDWFIDEVPWVQYYKGNYALHGTWWHNDFGRPKSHGCINLAPADARELFRWMDPVMPEGWYAVSSYYPHAKGTLVYIRH